MFEMKQNNIRETKESRRENFSDALMAFKVEVTEIMRKVQELNN